MNPDAKPLSCCVLLRCKSMDYRPDERPGRAHESDVMTYWCNATQDPEGPDGQTCRPTLCQPGRSCYKR